MVEFSVLVEPLPWGRNVYTVIRVPDDLAAAAVDWPTRRVQGRIEDAPVNVGLNRADVIDDTFIYVGAALRARIGARAGDIVHCRLEPADPNVVVLPDDVRDALDGAGRLAAFETARPARRRQLLAPIEGAARPETRQRRIAALVRGWPADGVCRTTR